jgi:hypothetical protein
VNEALREFIQRRQRLELAVAYAITGSHELLTVDKDFEAIARHAPLRLLGEHRAA